MVAAVTSRPWLVQMLTSPWSAGCCSRACRVSAYPGLPSRSTVLPMIRPGICRTISRFAAHEAEIRATRRQRRAERLASPQAMSAPAGIPHSPGGLITAITSGLTTAMASMPLAGKVGQRVDVFEHTEEIGCGNHERGEVLARMTAAPPCPPSGGGIEWHLDQFDRLVADDTSVRSCGRPGGFSERGTRMRRDFDLRLTRTAISTASASPEAPSYSEALDTSIAINAVIIDWYSYNSRSVPWLASPGTAYRRCRTHHGWRSARRPPGI